MKIGFVGLGQMGAPMAINLSRAHDVVVHARNSDAVAQVASHGAFPANGPSGFSDVDTVVLCLPSAEIVQHALFDPKSGLARHLKPGAIVVDTSTIEYGATIEIHKQLAAEDVHFLDAPVSGMRKRAEDGTLTMMIGGSVDLVDRLQGALSCMASKILHMGDVGAGQLTKLINQLLFDINAAALAEILPLASKLNIDPSKIGDVVNSGTGRSYASEFFIPHVLSGSFNNGYPMDAAYKDLISGAEISARFRIPTPVLAAATSTYQQALLEGHGNKDKGGMILVYERLLGVSFRAPSNYSNPASQTNKKRPSNESL